MVHAASGCSGQAQVSDRNERILHLLHACAERPLQSAFDATHAATVQARAEALLHNSATALQVRLTIRRVS
jgi:L-serine deaminase